MIETKIYERDRALFEAVKSLPELDRRDLTVSAIPFNSRASAAFRALGITTLGQVQDCRRHDLASQKGMGFLSCEQVYFYMAELGLPMRDLLPAAKVEAVEPPKNDATITRELIAEIRVALNKLEARLQ